MRHRGAPWCVLRQGQQHLTSALRLWVATAACVLWAGLGLSTMRAATESTNAHWAFQPVRAQIPPVNHATPSHSPIDAFIEARLKREHLEATGPADRATLIRRATFDLTGLPPSPAEVAAFVQDTSADAFSKLVDRLLQSPAYGERWGRHWMDVVRYADTAGDNADYPVPELHLYRDYIVRAFAEDKPYDVFVQEQLAGDILSKSRPRDAYAEGVIATSFLALSRRYGTGPFELWHLTLENTIETVGQAFLGLNLKCARCHDHKFDPVSMRDYYGLYGIFESTEFPWAGSEEIQSKQFNRQKFVPLVPDTEATPAFDAWKTRMEELKGRIQRAESQATNGSGATPETKKQLNALKQELRTLEKPGVPPGLPVAYGVREGKPSDTVVQKAGEPGRPGDRVPRCAPAALTGGLTLHIAPGSSGRLEFARWLTAPENPLTARVLVNRLWQYHFGAGLVSTPNNLGLRSEPPIHPELLDWLAGELVHRGWSIKSMHRLILNSEAYQRASSDIPASREQDPSNRSLWRFNRQRLDAESLRDAWLQVSGLLVPGNPGAQPFPGPERWTWTQHTPFKELYESDRRSVYLMTQRFQKHPFLALFDGPDTNNSTESRRVSTVPQQALFAMNNAFLDRCAAAFAASTQGIADTRTRVSEMAMRAWQRPLNGDEAVRLASWVQQAITVSDAPDTAWSALARVLLTANEFLYVD